MSTLPHRCLSSTTVEWEEVKIKRPVRAQRAQREAPLSAGEQATRPRRGWDGLVRLDWRKWTGLRMRYQHGRDPQIVVNARGREWSYPWDTALWDVLEDITNRRGRRPGR